VNPGDFEKIGRSDNVGFDDLERVVLAEHRTGNRAAVNDASQGLSLNESMQAMAVG
jgi:hypothetical protein